MYILALQDIQQVSLKIGGVGVGGGVGGVNGLKIRAKLL